MGRVCSLAAQATQVVLQATVAALVMTADLAMVVDLATIVVQALLAIAADYQQIVHLEQQHNQTEHAWNQGLHTLAQGLLTLGLRRHHILRLLYLPMGADQAMIVDQAIAVVLLAIVVDCQQIVRQGQPRNQTVRVWKADHRHSAILIQVRQLSFSRAMRLRLTRQHMAIVQIVATVHHQITFQFGSKLNKNLIKTHSVTPQWVF